jgi:membrane protease YdiL (CAAX protease family)
LKGKGQAWSLVKASTIAYSVMAVVGFEICWWYHKSVKTLMGPLTYDHRSTAAIIVAAIVFLMLVQKLMEDFFPTYGAFKRRMSAIFSGLGWFGVFWLALISSFGEELLFRGAIQPFLGLWFTSLVFGLLHLDPEGGVSAWTVWAMLAGVVLGAATEVTGSLWPAVVIHFVINLVGLRSLAKSEPKPMKSTQDIAGGQGRS